MSTLIVSGAPGAGKTTVSQLLAERVELGVHLHSDAFWPMIRSGYVEPWRDEAQRQNVAVIEATAAAALAFDRSGYTVVVDGILGPWFLDVFSSRYDSLPLHYVVLHPPVEVALARAEARRETGLADAKPLRQLHHQFAASDRIARHLLNNALLDPEHTAERIEAGVADGSFLVS